MRIALGGTFISAAWGKMIDPLNFYLAIVAFDMIPQNTVGVAAMALIWHELICATFMLLGLWTRAATILISGMLGVFLVGFAVSPD